MESAPTSETHSSSLYNTPFDTVLPYYLLSLILSLIIILSLVILEWVFTRFDFITLAFKAMFSVSRRRIRCFRVDITLTGEYYAIRGACKWVMRATTVTLLCFLWQSCLLFQKTFAVPPSPPPQPYQRLCESGLVCTYYPNSFRTLMLWTSSESIVNVCKIVFDSGDFAAAIHSSGYVTCIGMPKLDSIDVVVRFAIAYALLQLIIGTFEFLSWIVFLSRSRMIGVLYLVLAAITFLLFFVALILPQLFVLDSWFTSACYVTLPILFLCSRTAGLAATNAFQKQLVRSRSLDARQFSEFLSLPSPIQRAASDTLIETYRPRQPSQFRQTVSSKR